MAFAPSAAAIGASGGERTAGGTVYARSEWTPDEPERYPITLRGADGGAEYARILKLELVKGDPALAGLYEPEETADGTVLKLVIPPEGTTGEAEFLLTAESEHYEGSFSFSVRVADPGEVRISRTAASEEAAVGQAVPMRELWERTASVAGADRISAVPTVKGQSAVSSADFCFDGENLILLAPGRVDVDFRVSPGPGYVRTLTVAVYTAGFAPEAVPEPERDAAEAATPIGEAIRGSSTPEEGTDDKTDSNTTDGGNIEENGETNTTFGLVTLAGPDGGPERDETGSGEAADAGAAEEGTKEAGDEPDGGTAEETAGNPGEKPEEPSAGKESGDAGMWIYGPEKMQPGAKKFFKARFDGENPRKKKLIWSLDCGPETAQVFGNGQVWIRPKTPPGTVITLTCRAENRYAPGGPWAAEASMKIEVVSGK